jgi:Arc/MetJ-type ribon-helix-helix transcriptional regulator
MSYQFPPDLEQRVRARMSDGRYGSEDDLLRQAMDALDQLEQDKITRWHERNQIALEQSRHGLSKPLDDQAVLARLRQRLAKEGIVD